MSHSHHEHGHSHPHPHSHSHGHQDSTSSAFLGLITNIFLCALKLAGGYFLNSAALIADAAHSATDLLADAVTIVFLWVSAGGNGKKSEKSWTWGKGKFEPIGTLLVSLLLLSGGLGIGAHSLSLLSPSLPFPLPSFLTSIHSHSSEHEDEEEMDARAALFALFGIGIKEWLYQRTAKVARQQKSELLMASALHHRSDAMSSVVALVAIIGSALGFGALDPIGGLVVAVMILHQSFELFTESLFQLVDHTSPSLITSITSTITSLQFTNLPTQTLTVKEVRILKSGSTTRAFVTLEPPTVKDNVLLEVQKEVVKKVKGEQEMEEVWVSWTDVV